MAEADLPHRSARRSRLLLWAGALGAIALCYADLARGGETVAPILLVLGYCVLVPYAIMK